MKSSQLRGLQPFFTAVDGYADALARDTARCRCELTEAGRWHQPPARCPLTVVYDSDGPSGDGDPGSCRTIVHVVIRFHLAQLRMPVDHLTDPELDVAVDELHTLCLRATEVSVGDFADGIQQALHAERVAAAMP